MEMLATMVPREGWPLVSEGKGKNESRTPIETAMEASGFDCHERFFTARSSTREVRDRDRTFHLRCEAVKNSVVSIRLLRTRHGPPDSGAMLSSPVG